MNDKPLLEQFVDLSNIFKDGFMLTVFNGKIDQFHNKNRPYIVATKALVTINKTIDPNMIVYVNPIPTRGIIGGWNDEETGKYQIAQCVCLTNKKDAVKEAKRRGQRYIYHFFRGECIEVE